MLLTENRYSGKVYAIIMIIAVSLLLFISSITYRELKSFEDSSGKVSHIYQVSMEINHMFSLFSLLKSEELNYVISKNSTYLNSIENYKSRIDLSLLRIDSLTSQNPNQQKNIDLLNLLKENLYTSIKNINLSAHQAEIDQDYIDNEIAEINKNVESIDIHTDNMINEEQKFLKLRKEQYLQNRWFTLKLSLVMGLFALIILVSSFYKINRDREKITNTQSFLSNILGSTDNIISHFNPIRDSRGTIKDFEIVYTNDEIKNVTGHVAEEIMGKKVSDVYPILFENGVFEIFIECIETGKKIEYEKRFVFNGRSMWFFNTVIKLGEGLTLTSHNITKETLAKLELKKLNKRLEIHNSILKKAKSIAKLGSFELNLDSWELTLSDNMGKLFGYEPSELKSSYIDLLSIVHPKDRKNFNKKLLRVKEGKPYKEHTFRAITKNKDHRFFNISGTLETSDKNIFLAVVQDVTELLENEQILKSKNEDLKRSNEELKSFNRVASHDLQEPLRKIQMFISRIRDTDFDNLSEKGRTYFNTVTDSALRMQKLIHYLLMYSRVNRADSIFEKTDMNIVLEKVKEDFGNLIDENLLEIHSTELPVLNAVFFQMEQLFTNIISNSFKYSKADKKAVVTISSETVNRDEIKSNSNLTSALYHKISFKDNGIGFKQEYAEKIFELFQRLHGKTEYGGTGIGLAICKKIVEQHYGFIEAESSPGEGAVFHIYLPVK